MSNNYTLGRGELYFNKFGPNQAGIGERYFGNTPEINVTAEIETLDHFNSDQGIRVKDQSVVLEVTNTGSFTTDNISPENLALFFFGSAEALSQVGDVGESDTFTDVKPGLFYQLGVTSQNPTGARAVKNVVVEDDATPTPTTFVEGTDYRIEAELGRIEIIPGGAITDGTNLVVTYDTDAYTQELIVSGESAVEGELRFISRNPVGDKIDYYWPWVKIMPNGDFALKSDEWQAIPFNFEVLQRTGYERVYATKRPNT